MKKMLLLLFIGAITQRDCPSVLCSSCAVFDICKGSIAKRVCYVDIMKVHKHSDYPDPKCPQSLICDYIL